MVADTSVMWETLHQNAGNVSLRTLTLQVTSLAPNQRQMLSATERSFALKYEELEHPTLIHKPHDEANEALKVKVLQHIRRQFAVSSRHMFPENQDLLESS